MSSKPFASRTGLACAALTAAVLIVNCSRSNPAYSGGGTLVENAKVTGIVYDKNSRAVPSAIVTLRKFDSNPYLDAVRGFSTCQNDTTDVAGRFDFITKDTGFFNIEAFGPADQTKLLISEIHLGGADSNIVRDDTLKQTGAISITLPDSMLTEDGYVYIPGTRIYEIIDSSDIAVKAIVLDSVPAGKIQDIRFGLESDTTQTENISDSVDVLEGDTTNVIQ
jgi:hypothetical protein